MTENFNEFDLCSVDYLKAKGTLRFEFTHEKDGRHEIGLFWDGEAAYAIESYCPHEFALLTYGFIQPGQVICPLHGAVFDLTTGECLDRFTDDTIAYATEVREQRVWVTLPGEKR